MAHYQHAIALAWQIDLRLTLCHRAEQANPPLRSWRFLKGPFGLDSSGEAQLKRLGAVLRENPRAVFIHRLENAHAILQLPPQQAPVFFDLDDVEHIAFVRMLRQPPYWRSKFLNYLQWPAIVALERRIAKRAKATFVCSELDAVSLTRHWKMPRVVAIPNAVEVPRLDDAEPEPVVLFVGSFSYKPNVDAAEHLVANIWPVIRQQLPEARLEIAGIKPEQVPSFHKSVPGVTFLGFVGELDAVYRRATVVCCPILSGGGTRVKIVEAAAFAKSIVSSTVGAEGLDFEPGKEILLEDSVDGIAAACVSLLRDRLRSAALGEAARAKVLQLYDRKAVVAKVTSLMQTAMA